MKSVKAKIIKKNKFFTCQSYDTTYMPDIEGIVNNLEEVLSAKNASIKMRSNNISMDFLNLSGEMFIYLITCPNDKLDWILFYKELISK